MFPSENRFTERKELIVTVATETGDHNVQLITRVIKRPEQGALRCATFAIAMAVSMLTTCASSQGKNDDQLRQPVPAVTGTQLTEALNRRRGTVSTGVALRQVVTELQDTTGIAVVLDRRIDPSSSLNLTTGFVTIRQSIQAMAEARSARASFGDRVVVIAPPVAAGRLRTLMEINRDALKKLRTSLDSTHYTALTRTHDYSWEYLAEPRTILTQAAKAAEIQVTNPDRIPHDLWAAARLPPMTFSDFATLVLNQFDFTFEISDGGLLTISETPETVSIERRHRIPLRDKEAIIARWTETFPELNVEWRGAAAIVNATVETHERLSQLIDGPTTTTDSAGGLNSRRFSMKLPDGTRYGTLIASLRAQVPIRLQNVSDRRLAELLRLKVQFDVRNMSASEFFPMAFAGLPADVEITDTEVVLKFRDE